MLVIAIMEDKLFGLDNGLAIKQQPLQWTALMEPTAQVQQLQGELMVIWYIAASLELGFQVIFYVKINLQIEKNENWRLRIDNLRKFLFFIIMNLLNFSYYSQYFIINLFNSCYFIHRN